MSTAHQRPFEPEPTPLLEEDPAPSVQPLTGEDEWVGEKTILIAEQSEPEAWLQRVDTGEWLCLGSLPAVIGRHERADIHLDDPSVSRRHAQLLREGEQGFVIEDLGSANGVRVEGTRVDRLMILDGDCFDLGHITMRFSSRAPDALESTTPLAHAMADSARGAGDLNTRRMLPVLVAAVALAVAVAMYMQRGPRTAIVPAPASDTASALASAALTDAARTASSVPPGDPITDSRSPAARLPASPIPQHDGAASSPVSPDQTTSALPEGTAESAETPPSADSPAQGAPGRGTDTAQSSRQQGAGATTADASSVDVDGVRMRRLTPPPEAAPARPVSGATVTPKAADLGRAAAKAPVAARPRPKPSAPSGRVQRSPEFSRAYIDTALQMYLDGDSANAIRRLGIMSRSLRNQKQFRDEAVVLQQQVQALVANYEQGQSALDRGDRAEAAASWARFLRDEGDLFGSASSVYAKRISRVVAEQYIRDGDQANAEGRFHDAYRSWTKALQYQPDGVARDSIARLELKGQEQFREGYRLESVNIERAMALWTEVTELLPPDTEYHMKARAKLRWHQQGGR